MNGLLLELNISCLTVRRYDRQISQEVADNHGSDVSAGNYNKHLLAGATNHFVKLATTARTTLYSLSLPWNNNGLRLVSNRAIEAVDQKLAAIRDEFNGLKPDFARRYPDLIESDRRRLNGMFQESDYPSPQTVLDKFNFVWGYWPVPTGDHILSGLVASEVASYTAKANECTKRSTEMLNKATTDIFLRIKERVSYLLEKLNNCGTVDNSRMRNSITDSIREFVDLIPLLNLQDNADVTAFADRMRSELCIYDADILRTSPAARDQTAAAAKDMLDKLESYL